MPLGTALLGIVILLKPVVPLCPVRVNESTVLSAVAVSVALVTCVAVMFPVIGMSTVPLVVAACITFWFDVGVGVGSGEVEADGVDVEDDDDDGPCTVTAFIAVCPLLSETVMLTEPQEVDATGPVQMPAVKVPEGEG